MSYRAPLDDIRSALDSAAGLAELIGSGVLDGLDGDVVTSILTEAGRFADDVLAPLDGPGDRTGLSFDSGRVKLPSGWSEAYKHWVDGGWSTLSAAPEWGGQGMPHVVAMAVGEIWNSACLSFGLNPLLTQGAIEALQVAASDELKARYLPKMVAGVWTGTMNLTEPQAGSDLGALKTTAERQGDGSFRLHGSKIFITYGEHELTENIIHLVIARIAGAPAGTRGISLFLVPKFIVDADGGVGARNDVVCAGIESKLGIHASPTCVMTFGEREGAVGYLVGEENKGLAAMFIMMNRARLAVGVQGVAVAERASQKAVRYANERRQGRTESTPAGASARIVEHPDVRRNLLDMRSLTAAARSICLATARELDISERAKDAAARARAAARAALLTPIAKAFSTDIGVEVASIGVQVHGGLGFIEATGAAQHYRDARILPIYEGTNGIQAIDLVTRKLPLDGGTIVREVIAELAATAREVAAINDPSFGRMGARLADAVGALAEATEWMGARLEAGESERALASATPYLRLFGLALGASLLAKGAMTGRGVAEARGMVTLARHFAESHAAAGKGLLDAIATGGDAVLAADPSLFAA